MLKDKIILITGASRGIGKSTAEILAKNGAKIIINYNKSENEAIELTNNLNSKGFNAVSYKADVSVEEEVKNMFDYIKDTFGKLDILINNAGIMINGLVMLTSLKNVEKMMSVNFNSTFLCTRYAFKMMMKNKGGKIINSSSIVGLNGAKGQAVYSASKSAIIGFTKSCAKEFGNFGITVNAVAPGMIKTELLKDFDENFIKDCESKIPLGKLGSPEDVANVLLFLCSNYSNYITGKIIEIDGGITL